MVAALRNNSQFSTLAGLIETAGMADTLSRSGSYTLFAPTNAAFDKLPQNVRDQLGQEQHRDQLRAILAQHVVEGHSLASTQLPEDIKAMGGDPIDVSLTNGRPRLHVGEPQPQPPQTRTAESTAATPAPAPTPSATNQDLTDALSALENANQALAGDGQDNQAARDQLARARQAIDRGQLQTTERQPLQQASRAIDRATQALQNNDRAAARTAVNEALPPLRQAEAATPSSANQTNQRTAAQDTTRRSTDAHPGIDHRRRHPHRQRIRPWHRHRADPGKRSGSAGPVTLPDNPMIPRPAPRAPAFFVVPPLKTPSPLDAKLASIVSE